jgi:predicted secreted protein
MAERMRPGRGSGAGTRRTGSSVLARALVGVLLVAAAGCADGAGEQVQRDPTPVVASPGATAAPTAAPTAAATVAPAAAPTAAPTAAPKPGPASPPRTLTPADDGAVVQLRVGQTVELVVPGPAAAEPRVEGEAVALVEVRGVRGGGGREWEVRAVRAGTAYVRGAGPDPWTLTFHVRG